MTIDPSSLTRREALTAIVGVTAVAQDRALGVHVRYFLPALPALAIALVPPGPHLHQRWTRAIGVAMIVALAASVVVVQIGFVARYDWWFTPGG